MLDVEFISEIAVAHLNGIQNKKKKLEEYYQQYERSFEMEETLRSTFVKTLGEISQVLPNIAKTRWKKKSDFYSLFLCFSAHESCLPLSSNRRAEAQRILMQLASRVDLATSTEPEPSIESDESAKLYAKNVMRAASDLASRTMRVDILKRELAPVFAEASTQPANV